MRLQVFFKIKKIRKTINKKRTIKKFDVSPCQLPRELRERERVWRAQAFNNRMKEEKNTLAVKGATKKNKWEGKINENQKNN